MCSRRIVAWVGSLALLAALSACTIRDDSTRENQLESLRVLGIASSPADLTTGDVASLSALVYEPTGQTPSYQWSWCPARGGADDDFACLISEAELQAAWATLNTGTTLPPYDLGTGETAAVELVFDTSQVFAICELLSVDQPEPELALFACLARLGLSIELRVTTATEEIVALKSIPVVEADAERNQNPAIGSGIALVQRGGGVLQPGDPLRAERVYDLTVDIDLSESETFLPEAQEGQDPPVPQGEALFLSWFVTTGSTHRKGDVRTSYFEGGELESLVENTWDMDFDITTDTARLFLVLRDERTGISWTEYQFDLLEAP